MKIDEVVNWKGQQSSAINSMGKDIPDEILPAGIKATDDEGTTYEWKGRQWVNPQNQRVAKRDVGQSLSQQELSKDHTGDVYVRFQNGYEYIYHDMQKSIYDTWMNSSSKGTYLNQHIKPNYAVTRVV